MLFVFNVTIVFTPGSGFFVAYSHGSTNPTEIGRRSRLYPIAFKFYVMKTSVSKFSGCRDGSYFWISFPFFNTLSNAVEVGGELMKTGFFVSKN